VIFASDHGESLGEHDYFFEHGAYLYEATLRIPLIVKFPRSQAQGLRLPGKAMIVDIMPTILSLAGVERPPRLPGKDLRLYLDGREEPHPVCYAESGRKFVPENPRRYVEGLAGHWTSIRSGRHKLIRIPKPQEKSYELYDLANDPGETRNLYQAQNQVAHRLASLLEDWLRSFVEREPAPGAPEPRIDEEMAETLRAMGYMD
jgi:arylsulfatase A-like enzyme